MGVLKFIFVCLVLMILYIRGCGGDATYEQERVDDRLTGKERSAEHKELVNRLEARRKKICLDIAAPYRDLIDGGMTPNEADMWMIAIGISQGTTEQEGRKAMSGCKALYPEIFE